MTSEQKASTVSTLCLAFCFLCLGYAVYCVATVQMNRAMLAASGVALFMRVDLWFQKHQKSKSNPPTPPSV